MFSKGVPLVYTHTHTPPRQHPEQVFWSFSTLNHQQQVEQQQQQQQCEGKNMPSKSQCLRPRLCTLEKGDNGYGFHLHGEKGKTGQFIRLVEPDSPAETSGLRAGDRLVFVNGDDVENESHQQVVSRIRATAGRLELVVVDPDTEQLLKKHNMKCLQEYVTDGVPLPFDEEEEEEEVVVEEQQQQQQRQQEEEEAPPCATVSRQGTKKCLTAAPTEAGGRCSRLSYSLFCPLVFSSHTLSLFCKHGHECKFTCAWRAHTIILEYSTCSRASRAHNHSGGCLRKKPINPIPFNHTGVILCRRNLHVMRI